MMVFLALVNSEFMEIEKENKDNLLLFLILVQKP